MYVCITNNTIDRHELSEDEASMGALTKLTGRLFAPVAEAAGIEASFDALMLPQPCRPAKRKPHGSGPHDG